MKILKLVTVEQEVTVHVTAADIAQALIEDGDESENALEAINNIACFLNGLPDSRIKGMNNAQRELIGVFLREQAVRFLATSEDA